MNDSNTSARLSPMVREKHIRKAATLVEALPFIRQFVGKTFVVKFGGSLLDEVEWRDRVIEDIALLKRMGIQPVLVHGGGPAVTTMLNRLDKNKETTFVDGYRVTDSDTLNVAEMVLSGKLNKTLVAALQMHGVNAMGLSGQDGGTMIVKKRIIKDVDMGFEGEITHIDTNLIKTVMNNGFVPVVSPIGMDVQGQAYNLNGDIVGVALASALKAEKLIFLTDVVGVLRSVDDPTSHISSLTVDEARDYIVDGTIYGGMLPKVECCVDAVEQGVRSVHILDGRLPHAMLLEFLTSEGWGTRVTMPTTTGGPPPNDAP